MPGAEIPSSGRLNQPLLQRLGHGGPARSHAEFAAYVAEVIVDAGLAAAADAGDFPGRFTRHPPLQDFLFPGSEGDCLGQWRRLRPEVGQGRR
ncbi:hypothetical protein D3C73_760970 [compost metagenome]